MATAAELGLPSHLDAVLQVSDLPSLPTGSMQCLRSDGITTATTWRLFNVNCPKVNLQCNTTSSAWVAASTVCSQSLF